MRALIIPADRDQPIKFTNTTGELKELQALVGGYIQPVFLRQIGATMYVDEEGKLKLGAVVNVRAAEIVEQYAGRREIIMGDALLLGIPDGDGDTSLPDGLADLFDYVYGPAAN